MRPIRLYLAGSLGLKKDSKCLMELIQDPLPNRLVSFAYPGHLQEWLDYTEGQKGRILIDSGAFSGWNKGTPIDIDEYIAYCHEGVEKCEQDNKEVRVVCLDVIPGKKGETANLGNKLGNPERLAKNKTLVDKAAQQGLDNMLEMKKQGLIPIHVFHQGEDWKWLDKMLEHTDYIGVSPANDLPNKARNSWMRSVFTYLHKNGVDCKTHGFAVNSYTILRDLPWESCDAASWVLSAAYGNVFMPAGGYVNPDFSKKSHVLKISSQQNGRVTGHYKKLLEQTGYSLEEIQEDYNVRKLLNARYLQTMEKYLNKYKKHNEFSPIKTLI